ncbi:MAG: AAA family ATPase [Actinomycetota bacterium]|nr:AAA family ATPase [Actinomycetota bacterium]
MGGGTRRTVTAVFVDVVGSTSIAEQMDPEAFASLMSRFFTEMSSVVERHGGMVEKFVGDAVKASFGVPVAHEDDALRAVRAAVEMRESLAKLNEDLRSRWGFALQTRIGINTGEVMSVTHGDHVVALGDAMNVAARLEQTAAPNQIVIGPTTYELVQHAVDARPLAPLTLKGKGHEVVAYAVETLDPEVEAIRRHLDRPMVGREPDVLALEDVLEEAGGTPGCSLVMVVGEPGIGKSRLVAEIKARLQARRALFLIGGCLPYGQAATYAPIARAVTRWFASSQDEVRDIRTALATTVAAEADSDVIASRIFQLMGLEEPISPPEELFWGLRKLLEALAREHPLVVAIEDLHWAEPSLVGLLDHLVEWTRDAAVILICSCRPEFLDLHPQWERKARMTLRLEPLPHEEARILVRGISSATLGPERTDEVVAVSGGNPLFIEQLASMLDDADTAAGSAGGSRSIRLPPSIQALLAARLDMLAPAEREVLEAAAVVGAEFSARAVAQIVPQHHVTQVFEILDSLIAKNLVQAGRWDSLSGPVFAFRHALIREAAYDALPHEERAERHERLAKWLEALDPPAPPEIAGYHYEQAFESLTRMHNLGNRRQVLAQRGAALLAEAGFNAANRHELDQAWDLLQRAWELSKICGVWSFPIASLWAKAAQEGQRRNKTLHEMRLAFKETGDARFDAAALLLEAQSRASSDPDYSESALLADVQRSISLFEGLGPDEVPAEAYSYLALVYEAYGQGQEGLAAARRAVEYAERRADPTAKAWALRSISSLTLDGPGSLDEARVAAEDLLRFAKTSGQREMEAIALVNIASVNARQGQTFEARKTFQTGYQIAEQLERAGHSRIAFAADDIFREAGELDLLEAYLRKSSEWVEKRGHQSVQASVLARLAEVLYRQGRIDDAQETVRRARASTSADDVDAIMRLDSTEGKLHALRGDCTTALELTQRAVDRANATEWLVPRAMVLMDRGEVLRICGHTTDAQLAIEHARRLYSQKGHVEGARRANAHLASLETPE